MLDRVGPRVRLLLLEVDDLAMMLMVTSETFDRRAEQARAAIDGIEDEQLRARLAARLEQVHERARRPSPTGQGQVRPGVPGTDHDPPSAPPAD